jgi:hypothetical protein
VRSPASIMLSAAQQLRQLGLNKSHPGRLTGTAEMPHQTEEIAAVPNASSLCDGGSDG